MYLQNKAEVSRGLVFVFKVFAVVDVYVVELDKADEVTGWLKRNKRGFHYILIRSVFFVWFYVCVCVSFSCFPCLPNR